MSDDNFNLDQVMEEHDERKNSVEELPTKDELTQDDFSSDVKECGCAAKENKISMSYYAVRLVTDSRKLEALGLIDETHRNYLKAKSKLYKVRSEFYTKENREKCKELTGKDTDGVFREFFKQLHLDLMEARELAEFEYEQAKRVYESL